MNIITTGDTHGKFHLLNNRTMKTINRGDFPDIVAIMGDAGYIFLDDPEERYWHKWLNEKPWITCATIGNHENYNRIYKLPLVDFYGGKAYKVSDKVYYLKHGEIYIFGDVTVLNFGGADSIDKAYRTPYKTWWPEEIPTQEDYRNAIKNLSKVSNKVDYVWSHTAPTKFIQILTSADLLPFGGIKLQDPTVSFLDAIESQITYKRWLFGHFHVDFPTFPRASDSFRALYELPFLLS